jgi:endonuclease III
MKNRSDSGTNAHNADVAGLGDFSHMGNQTLSKLCQSGKTEYNGNARKIWEGKNSSAEIIYRFLCFDGCGIKIASMATNLLHRIFGINYTDYSALDISPDIHVRRVFYRLGLVDNIDDVDSVIYKARSLHPSFPGVFDKCCWNIGRDNCHPSTPQCNGCRLSTICKKGLKKLNF